MRTSSQKQLVLAAVALLLGSLAARPAAAHCDTLAGPVVLDHYVERVHAAVAGPAPAHGDAPAPHAH